MCTHKFISTFPMQLFLHLIFSPTVPVHFCILPHCAPAAASPALLSTPRHTFPLCLCSHRLWRSCERWGRRSMCVTSWPSSRKVMTRRMRRGRRRNRRQCQVTHTHTQIASTYPLLPISSPSFSSVTRRNTISFHLLTQQHTNSQGLLFVSISCFLSITNSNPESLQKHAVATKHTSRKDVIIHHCRSFFFPAARPAAALSWWVGAIHWSKTLLVCGLLPWLSLPLDML